MTPIEKITQDFQGKNVLIFGLGLQGRGVGCARFFSQLGARVTVTDQKTRRQLSDSLGQLKDLDINYTLGEHKASDVESSNVIIRNASVPWDHQLLKLARRGNVPIKMDAALFFEYCQPTRSIGVTGTRGKSTTTNLIYQILKSSGKQAVLAGNAVPAASVDLIKDYQPETYYVFELSSWQLQAFHQEKISPHLAVLTNLYPDHLLDRSFDQYSRDKTAIFAYQTKSDVLFYNADQSDLKSIIDPVPGQAKPFSSKDLGSSIQSNLKGDHNRQNIAAALAVANHLGLDKAISLDTIKSFKPLPFRLQPHQVSGLTIINDSTSTTPIAVIKALETYPNAIVILGGPTKNLSWAEAGPIINSKAKHVILLSGTGTEELKSNLNKDLIALETASLKQAFSKALELAKSDNTILFSPGFPSFGLFKNEFDRGRQFDQLISSLS